MSGGPGDTGAATGEVFPASPRQRHLWRLMEEAGEGREAFRVTAVADLRGELHPPALERVARAAVEELEILRTAFRPAAGEAVLEQVVVPHAGLRFSCHGVGDGVKEWRPAPLAPLEPLDLATGRPLDVAVLRLADDHHRVRFSLPALCADQESLLRLARHLLAAAAGPDDGGAVMGEEEPFQYPDLAAWANGLQTSPESRSGRDRWARVPAPARHRPSLPGASPEAVFTPRRQALPGGPGDAVRRLAGRLEVAPDSLLLAAWAAVLHRSGHGGDGGPPLARRFDGRQLEELAAALGPLARNLPLTVSLSGDLPFAAWAKAVDGAAEQAERTQDFFSWDLLERAGEDRGEPFAPFPGEPVPAPEAGRSGGLEWSLAEVDGEIDRYVAALRWCWRGAELDLELKSDAGALSAAEADLLGRRLGRLLAAALDDPEVAVDRLPVLDAGERQHVLEELNRGVGEVGEVEPFLHRAFFRQAEERPHRLALRAGDEEWTYGRLAAEAAALAPRLRALGVGPDTAVGVLVHRSPPLLVAIFAVLAAGGAYLPLDPTYPRRRLAFMVRDAAAPLVLTLERHRDLAQLSDSLRVVALDGDDLPPAGGAAPEPEPVPEHLAYLIYTSGSSGRPKGVMVTHRNAALSTAARCAYYDGPEERFLLLSSHAFDSSVAGIFGALSRGDALVLAREEVQTDPAALAGEIAAGGVSALLALPSLHNLLLDTAGDGRLAGLRRVVVAGEACPPDLVRRHAAALPAARLYNEYGPTEGTVWSTVHACAADDGEGRVPIGRPVGATRVYVLAPDLRPVPAGAAGEIVLAGPALARGYRGRPGLTASRFVPDPFGREGGRAYRTGDLGRHRPDGRIDFLGRVDDQVKIRGYRIEPGEVEAALRGVEGVRDAAVVPRSEEAAGSLRLVAYVVGEAGANLTVERLREALTGRLPGYMVPAAFVSLPDLPRTPNGKVDRKALPAPDEGRMASEVGYRAPRSPEEKLMAGVWAGVLGVEQVGLHDRFFDIGGDSILAIQAASRARQAGLAVTPRQLFQHQTIAELVPLLGDDATAVAEQGPVVGPVAPSPVVRWWLDLDPADPHHWNQALMFHVAERVDGAAMVAAAARLQAHHDALRLRLTGGPGGDPAAAPELSIAPPGEPPPVAFVDLSALPPERRSPACGAAAAAAQRSLDLAAGPLWRAAVFDFGGDTGSRLLLACHHLVVDGVSWRILLEDLPSLYLAGSRGEAVSLPPKTASLRQWSEALEAAAAGPEVAAELAYWQGLPWDRVAPLPRDRDGGGGLRVGDAATLSSRLPAAPTERLLRRAPEALRARIDELLLAALARVLARWTGSPHVLVELESHGRAAIPDPGGAPVDVARTVGWLTATYPALLSLETVDGPPEEAVRAVKEQLRAIPDPAAGADPSAGARGLGWGLLRYLSPDPAVRQGLARLPVAEVGFNYLGQFDQVLPREGSFGLAPEPPGPDRSPRGRRGQPLTIDGRVAGGRLGLDWTYDRTLHDEATIRTLADGLLEELRRLVELVEEGADAAAPSDFPLADLEQDDLSRLAGALEEQDGGPRGGVANVEDVYPLSPLQSSLLAHVLARPGSSVGFEQSTCILEGELDGEALLAAWRRTVERHSILRTAFISREVREPLQVVRRRVEVPMRREDWSRLAEGEREERLDAFLEEDRRRGFDPASAPLFRLALIRLAPRRHALVWSHHHLILDGWCNSILLREVFAGYGALARDAEPVLPPAVPFRRYIAWLQRQRKARAEEFWRRAFAGYGAGPTPLGLDLLPVAGDGASDGEPTGRREAALEVDATVELQAFARRHGLTVNTLVQGAWACLLSHYSGRGDVVWGIGVSGRPPDLAGVDAILGMFINNLPVRATVPGKVRVLPWLRGLQERLSELGQFEHSAPEQVQAWSGMPPGRRPFDSLVLFQNYPTGAPTGEMEERDGELRITSFRSRLETSYAVTLVAVPGRTLNVAVHFDRRRVPAAAAEALLAGFRRTLAAMVESPDTRLRDLPAGPARLSSAARGTAAAAAPVRAAEADPLSPVLAGTALADSAGGLAGDRLARRAGDWAGRLREAEAGAGRVVALKPGGGAARVVALLAILETGAACAWLDGAAGPPPGTDLVVSAGWDGLRVDAGAGARAAGTAGGGSWLLPVSEDGATSWLLQSAPAAAARVRALAAELTRDGGPGPGDEVVVEGPAGPVELLAVLHTGARLRVEDPAGGAPGGDAGESRDESRDGGAGDGEPRRRWRWAPADGWAARLGEGGPAPAALVTGGPLARGLALGLGLLPATGPEGSTGPRRGRFLFAPRPGWVHPGPRLVEEGGAVALGDADGDLRLLDRWGRPALPGAEGELWLGGGGDGEADPLPTGWWGEAARTALELRPDPDSGTPGRRLWRCGRRGRRLASGGVELLAAAGPGRAPRPESRQARERWESVLRRHPGLTWCRVVTVAGDDGGEVAVACWVAVAGSPPTPGQVRAHLAAALPAGDLPAGFQALRRSLTRAELAAGPTREDLRRLAASGGEDELVEPRTTEELALVEIWERAFDRRPIGVTQDFFELGGHSLLAVRLMAEVEERFGRKVPVAELLRGGSIEALARRLAADPGAAGWSPLVPIRPGGDAPPLVCVHPAGGSVFRYVALAHHLGREIPVYGLQARGHLEGQTPLDRVEDLAALYLDALEEGGLDGPVALAGWSFGGVVAFEMARRLVGVGRQVVFLGMLDAAAGMVAWEDYDGPMPDRTERLSRILGGGLVASPEELRAAGDDDAQLCLIVERARERGLLPAGFELSSARRYLDTLDHHAAAVQAYRPGFYPGRVDLFRAEAGLSTHLEDPTMGWGGLAEEVEIHPVPGRHDEMLQAPRVAVLAESLGRALAAASAVAQP